MNERTVLVTGATGNQCGAVIRELRAGGSFTLRGLTRKPESEAAQALAAQGVGIVEGDLNDAASLENALRGVWGVFSVQNSWEAGVELEEEQGKRLAMLARASGVQHVVYTSMGQAHRETGILHSENKGRIEATVRSLDFPSHVILRPVFFMEDFLLPGFVQGNKLTVGIRPDTVLQMVAVADIGRYGALAFEKAEKLNRDEIVLAGDAATMPRAAGLLGEARGEKVDFVPLSPADIRRNMEGFPLMEDVVRMFEWFDRVGYDADIAGNEKKYGIRATRAGRLGDEERKALALIRRRWTRQSTPTTLAMNPSTARRHPTVARNASPGTELTSPRPNTTNGDATSCGASGSQDRHFRAGADPAESSGPQAIGLKTLGRARASPDTSRARIARQ